MNSSWTNKKNDCSWYDIVQGESVNCMNEQNNSLYFQFKPIGNTELGHAICKRRKKHRHFWNETESSVDQRSFFNVQQRAFGVHNAIFFSLLQLNGLGNTTGVAQMMAKKNKTKQKRANILMCTKMYYEAWEPREWRNQYIHRFTYSLHFCIASRYSHRFLLWLRLIRWSSIDVLLFIQLCKQFNYYYYYYSLKWKWFHVISSTFPF